MHQDFMKAIQIPRIMGIINLTEDSFSDGGYYLSERSALAHAEKLIQEGAEILDLGAESTRPGSKSIPAHVEWQRIEPVLKALKELHPEVLISIDTQKAKVAELSIACGANIINDISAMRFDPDMPSVLKNAPDVKVILMHMQGNPETMQIAPQYSDVVLEVKEFLKERIEYATKHGIIQDRIIIDPGIGFGKKLEHNLLLIKHMEEFSGLGCQVLLGTSRKRFIDQIYSSDVHHRLGGSLATTMLACLSGVNIIRVHDVQEHAQFLETLYRIRIEGD